MSVLWEILSTFTRLSFIAVGGGLAALAEMQREVVNVHHWVTAREFVDGFAIAQLTPGPGMLVTVFVGYRAAGVLGAAAATVGMFMPTSLVAWFLASRWQRFQGRGWAKAVEEGLAPLAIGLIASGVYTVGRTSLTGGWSALLAVISTTLLAFRMLPATVVILLSGVAGWFLLR